MPKLDLNVPAKYSEAILAHANSVTFKITKDKIYWLQ
jgi:hypothetical protein